MLHAVTFWPSFAEKGPTWKGPMGIFPNPDGPVRPCRKLKFLPRSFDPVLQILCPIVLRFSKKKSTAILPRHIISESLTDDFVILAIV